MWRTAKSLLTGYGTVSRTKKNSSTEYTQCILRGNRVYGNRDVTLALFHGSTTFALWSLLLHSELSFSKSSASCTAQYSGGFLSFTQTEPSSRPKSNCNQHTGFDSFQLGLELWSQVSQRYSQTHSERSIVAHWINFRSLWLLCRRG